MRWKINDWLGCQFLNKPAYVNKIFWNFKPNNQTPQRNECWCCNEYFIYSFPFSLENGWKIFVIHFSFSTFRCITPSLVIIFYLHTNVLLLQIAICVCVCVIIHICLHVYVLYVFYHTCFFIVFFIIYVCGIIHVHYCVCICCVMKFFYGIIHMQWLYLCTEDIGMWNLKIFWPLTYLDTLSWFHLVSQCFWFLLLLFFLISHNAMTEDLYAENRSKHILD